MVSRSCGTLGNGVLTISEDTLTFDGDFKMGSNLCVRLIHEVQSFSLTMADCGTVDGLKAEGTLGISSTKAS